jgi:hypothetical protein
LATVILIVIPNLRQDAPSNRDDSDGFQVVYETSLDGMDPMARGLLSGLSGGVVDVRAASRTQTDGGMR